MYKVDINLECLTNNKDTIVNNTYWTKEFNNKDEACLCANKYLQKACRLKKQFDICSIHIDIYDIDNYWERFYESHIDF